VSWLSGEAAWAVRAEPGERAAHVKQVAAWLRRRARQTSAAGSPDRAHIVLRWAEEHFLVPDHLKVPGGPVADDSVEAPWALPYALCWLGTLAEAPAELVLSNAILSQQWPSNALRTGAPAAST
jgi:hypothetical protein